VLAGEASLTIFGQAALRGHRRSSSPKSPGFQLRLRAGICHL